MANRIVRALRMLLLGQHYDGASNNPTDHKHWLAAKDDPPAVTNTLETRIKLRSRANYEADNNGYLGGLVDDLATDTVGYTPPKPQVLTDNDKINTLIEEQWKDWSEHRHVNLHAKLRILDRSKYLDGECFLYQNYDNDVESATGIGLNVDTLPARRVTDSTNYGSGAIEKGNLYNDDGVVIDLFKKRPVEYRVSTAIDGVYGALSQTSYTKVNANYMWQWYKPRKPEQYRGVCEVQASLPLYGFMRRFTLATISAAELAAEFAAILKTTNPVSDGAMSLTSWADFPIKRGMMTSLPDGWDISQFDPKHPAANYEMFINMILREVGRILSVPFGIVALDSSKYNFASGRLDYTAYAERLKYDRSQLAIRILNPLMEAFLMELGLLYPAVWLAAQRGKIRYSWNFTSRPTINPVDDATANEKDYLNGFTTLSEIYSARGVDWSEALTQRKKELTKMSELGLKPVVPAAGPVAGPAVDGNPAIVDPAASVA